MPIKIPRALLGAIYSFFAFFLWSCSDALTKKAGIDGVAPLAVTMVSGWGAVITILFTAFISGKARCLKPHKWKGHIVRSVIGTVLGLISVVTFTNLPMTTAYVGLFASPLLISLLGRILFKEYVGLRRVVGIAIGFVGVLIALIPDMMAPASPVHGDAFLGYLSLLFFVSLYVTDMLLLRFLGCTETTQSLNFIPFLFRSLVLIPFFLLYDQTALLLNDVLILLVIGGALGVAFMFITLAYKMAPVSIVSPFHYTQLITGGLLGYLFFNDIPSLWTWVGGALIIVSGLLIARAAQKYQES